ncbi:helix-turn-helix transcriptional regulator [Frigidibacter sp. RF13]|uniref:helix-turn-helix domain-containing protein n=1 Tax=Frigidibacter sp. RF13 TaxID=2997340 RepID=UPI00226DE306|nr:helix-turn-helix transcriptional regulator [Frigidibacter sp. RF13]MCY1126880.1 helix-turn-helix transcriptional regulator [Frigidibacter sp. RF13]
MHLPEVSGEDMITLPLVWVVSVLTTIAALALAQDMRLPLPARCFLCHFLMALAAIALLLGFRLSFDSALAARLQPLVAVMVGPLAYLGFAALSQDVVSNWRSLLVLNGVPVALAQLAILARIPVSADVFVLGVTSLYLFRMSRLLHCEADQFVHVAPNAQPILRSAIYATLVLLGLMVATDLSIVAAGLVAGEAFILTFLTGVSGIFTVLIFVAALVGTSILMRGPAGHSAKAARPTTRDGEMLAALDVLMREKQLYKDSNLTLARVARRLSVPARDVSVAINGLTGENFSRYVNGFRVRYAQKALLETDLPITEVMFDAGFVSKSSFNTEFRRMTGQTPSKFRAGQADA